MAPSNTVLMRPRWGAHLLLRTRPNAPILDRKQGCSALPVYLAPRVNTSAACRLGPALSALTANAARTTERGEIADPPAQRR